MSAIAKTHGVDYVCLGKVPEPVGSRNFKGQEQDLASGDSVGLRMSNSLFKALDNYFLDSLFHIDIVVFLKPFFSIGL